MKRVQSKTKREQLVTALTKPNGVRVSVLAARFGLKPHSVRAEISGLRKRGFPVVTTRSDKSREAIYTIKSSSICDAARSNSALK